MHNCPLLAPKQTSARIDFLRQGGRLVDKKDTFCVKFIAEKFTAGDELTGGLANRLTSWPVDQLTS